MQESYEKIQLYELEIDLIRKDIKNIHLAVYPPDGRIRLSAPLQTKDQALRLFLISKLSWIRKQQKHFKSQARELPREYITGESHYFNGQRYLLQVIERVGKHEIKVKNKTQLELYVNPNTSLENRKLVFDEFYRAYLKEILPALIKKWEHKTGKACKEWQIRKMHTKWGSCLPEKSKIILNLELAKKPLYCLEYIIAHEFVHFFERTHNDNFIHLMDKFMPNWRVIRKELNELPVC